MYTREREQGGEWEGERERKRHRENMRKLSSRRPNGAAISSCRHEALRRYPPWIRPKFGIVSLDCIFLEMSSIVVHIPHNCNFHRRLFFCSFRFTFFRSVLFLISRIIFSSVRTFFLPFRFPTAKYQYYLKRRKNKEKLGCEQVFIAISPFFFPSLQFLFVEMVIRC